MPQLEAAVPAVPSFESVDELRSALDAKRAFVPMNLYPRDGTDHLAEVEGRLAELARVEDRELVLCCSGMAAVVNSIEAFMNSGSTVAMPNEAYSQTERYTNRHLRDRGIRVVTFNPADPDSVSRMVGKGPDIIFGETVTNRPSMGVLDVRGLFEKCDDADMDPYVVLDNTLPLSTGLDVAGSVDPDRKLLVVESATKAYALNGELAGIVYGKNPELITKIRAHRQTKGFGPNVGGVERIDQLLPGSVEVFDERNLRIFRATGALAAACFAVQPEGYQLFATSHTTLPNNPNAELAKKQLTEGGSPVFFIECMADRFGAALDRFELAERLWANPVIRQQCELGQSFGFDHTRILPDADHQMVRIAPGADTDVDALSAALMEVLADIKKEKL